MTAKSRPRVLVIGSLNVDLVARGERIPHAGETVMGNDFQQSFGGKGANQAVALARAGADVDFLGAVGDDEMGTSALKHLEACGVNVRRCLRIPGVNTGVALITIDETAENSIVIVPGANRHVTPARLDALAWADYEAVVLQLEIPLETVWAAIRLAAPHTKVILTPAPARAIPAELLPSIDVLVPNQLEVCLLGVEGEALEAARTLGSRIRGGIALTLGKEGVRWFDGSEKSPHVTPPRVVPVDTVGAGDCFTGYFAHDYAAGKPVEEALRRACAAAALQVTRKGAQSAMPSSGEVDEFLAASR